MQTPLRYGALKKWYDVTLISYLPLWCHRTTDCDIICTPLCLNTQLWEVDWSYIFLLMGFHTTSLQRRCNPHFSLFYRDAFSIRPPLTTPAGKSTLCFATFWYLLQLHDLNLKHTELFDEVLTKNDGVDSPSWPYEISSVQRLVFKFLTSCHLFGLSLRFFTVPCQFQ